MQMEMPFISSVGERQGVGSVEKLQYKEHPWKSERKIEKLNGLIALRFFVSPREKKQPFFVTHGC